MGLELAGLHRGIVIDNADPEKLGRIKARVDAAWGQQPAELIPWAWPCFTAGGSPDCGDFSLPEKGACVWVEFLWNNGEPDPACPVWTGVWFPKGGLPAELQSVAPEDLHYFKVQKSANGKHIIIMCDKPGEEYIRIKHGTSEQIIRFEVDQNAYMDSPQGDIHLNKEV